MKHSLPCYTWRNVETPENSQPKAKPNAPQNMLIHRRYHGAGPLKATKKTQASSNFDLLGNQAQLS